MDFDDDGEMVDPVPDDLESFLVRSGPPLVPESEDLGELRE